MAEEGATPRELIIEACRRNNTSLLEELFSDIRAASPQAPEHEQAIADLINNSRDGMGNAPLHIAAQSGAYETLDVLLDQSNVETDPKTRATYETPLFLAVQYTNELRPEDWPAGLSVVEILLDAGCDPRIRNKGGATPVQIADPKNEMLRDMLKKAEMTVVAGNDVVDEDAEDEDDDGPSDDE